MATSPFKAIKDWISGVRDAGNITLHFGQRWISFSNYAIVVKPTPKRLFSFYLNIGGPGTSAIAFAISEETNSDLAFSFHLYGNGGFMFETVSLLTPRKKSVRIWGVTRKGEMFDGWFGEPADVEFCEYYGLPYLDRD